MRERQKSVHRGKDEYNGFVCWLVGCCLFFNIWKYRIVNFCKKLLGGILTSLRLFI